MSCDGAALRPVIKAPPSGSAAAAFILTAAIFAVSAPKIAAAQVIEVQPGGELQTFSGPVRSVDGERQPIRTSVGLYKPPGRPTYRQNIPLIPAEAGTQTWAGAMQIERDSLMWRGGQSLGPRFRGDERRESRISPRGGASRFKLRADVAQALQSAAERSQLSVRLMEAVALRESGFNQGAVSAKGARGVMQLMPATAQRLGVDARDLKGNTKGGAAYMAALLRDFDDDIILALAAYNAGPEAVRRYGGIPPYPETRAFVAAVLDRLSQAAASSPSIER